MLEYGCTVWDPHRAYQKLWLEQVQCRAAHFITRTYTRGDGCVINALKQLSWPTLKKRRQIARLTLMYKSSVFSKNHLIHYLIHWNLSHFSHPVTRTNTAFQLRTITDWNSLPPDYLTLDSTAKFKASISDYIFPV